MVSGWYAPISIYTPDHSNAATLFASFCFPSHMPSPPPRTYTIGLTGGIGSGKSTVADLFAARGIALVDADVLAHRITAPGGSAIDALRNEFGDTAITPEGALDRAWMRRLAFGDDTVRRRLEAILHPMIRTASVMAVSTATSPYVMLVIPLLFESGNWRQRMQRTVVVDCSEAMQISRVIRRSGLSAEEVQAIMDKQIARAERLELADDIIDNSGDGSNLPEAVARLHALYLSLATEYRLGRTSSSP